jgi:hypothetical protein
MADHPLAGIPIAIVLLVVVGFALLAYEVGFRVGRLRDPGTSGEPEGAAGLVAGSLLALFAFMLAVTMGMAADRFEARRDLVLQESNAIETTFLRAGFLPEPERDEIRSLLREYIPLRIAVRGLEELQANDRRSDDIQDEMWVITERLAIDTPESTALGTFITSLNEMIDLENARLVVGVYGRVPTTVIDVLLLGGLLSTFVLGYHAGLGRRRILTSTTLFIVVLSAVVTLIIDLDWPRDGLISVSQQALMDLQAKLGPPP